MPVQASIIIPTKNAGNKFNSVLEGIFKSRVDFEYEVIIVDSGSTDRTKGVIAAYPARLIEIAPLSFTHGGARNIGAEAAKGKILVYLSQDAIPHNENWLMNLTKDFTDIAVAGVFGRQVPDRSASALEKFFLQYTYPDHRIVKTSVNPHNCALHDIFFSDVNSAIRRSEWEHNKFKEDLIMSEDQAWSKDMLLKKKKIIYAPDAVVCHSHNYTISRMIMRNFDSGLSLRDVVNASLKKSFLYEIKYLKNAALYFFKEKFYGYLFIVFFYEFFRLFGFLSGRYSRFFPLWVKKIFSENKIYWQQRQKR